MKRILLFITILIFFIINCILINPVTLIIQNDSDYDIIVNFDKGINNETQIKKGKGDFFLFYPDDIKIIIKIKEIDFKKDYDISLKYLNNYKFNFSLR